MKAMLLAAGRGERMRPLTDTIPKPLAPFRGGCLIEPLLYALAHAGVQEVVINVCYLAKQIVEYLGDGSRYSLHIQYAYEFELGGLETGGGVRQALPLLGDEPFLVVSADIVTDFPFARLVQQIRPEWAHLVFVDNPAFNPRGDFHLNAGGAVTTQGNNMLNFAGISVLHPRLFAECPSGKLPLSKLFHRAIAQGRMTGEHYRGIWHNVGTLAQLKAIE